MSTNDNDMSAGTWAIVIIMGAMLLLSTVAGCVLDFEIIRSVF